MKRSNRVDAWSVAAVAAFSALASGALLCTLPEVLGSTPGTDNASTNSYSGGWTNGANGGTAFQPWTLNPTSGDSVHGHFIGNSAGNGSGNSGGEEDINTTGSKAFGMYANSGNLAEAARQFKNGGLIVGQKFKLRFDNGWISTDKSVGISLRGTNDSDRFEFYFKGGDNQYRIHDNSSGTRSTSISFTDEGLILTFELTGTNTYSFTMEAMGADGPGGLPATFTGDLTGLANSPIDRIRFWNDSAGSGGSYDAFINSLELDCNNKPTTTASSDSPRCVGDDLHLSAGGNTGDTYSWTGPNSFSSTNQSPTISSVTTNAAGVYTVTRTENGCTSTGMTTTVVINTIPSTTAGNNGPVCIGQILTLTATGPTNGNYNWTGPSLFTSTSQNPSITNAQASNAGTYTVTLTVSNCASPASSTYAIVTNGATTVASSDSPRCEGDTLHLYATGSTNDTYSWTGPNSFTSSSQNPTISSVTTNAAGTYSVVRIVPGCGTSDVSQVSVTIKTNPVVVASNNGPICAGATLTLSATGNASDTYSWTGPNGFSSTNQNPSIVSATTAASGTYTVTRTVDGCSGNGQTIATVNANPSCSISGASSVCASSTGNSYSGPAGLSYVWSITGNGTIVGSTTSQSVSVDAGSAGSFTLTLTVTDGNGCTSQCNKPVTVSALPTAAVSGSTNVCQGSSATIQATLTGAANWILTWSDGVITTNASSPATRSVSPSSTTVYTITAISDANCAGSASGSATVTINTAPSITSQPSPGVQTNRYGSAMTNSVTATGTGLSYQWHKSAWGTGGWTLTTSGSSGTGGHFIGSSANNGTTPSGNINSSGESWGMYANGETTAEAVRQFYAPISVDQVFKLDFDNGWIDTGASVGWGLRNSLGENRFEFYFKGGNANYFVNDIRGLDQDTGIAWTDGGMHTEFTLTGLDTYSIKVIRGTTTNTVTGTLGGTTGTGIDRVRFFNYRAGSGSNYDAYYNNLELIGRTDNAADAVYDDGWGAGDSGGSTAISGATNASYIVSSVSTNDAGRLWVVVTGGCPPSATSTTIVRTAVGYHKPTTPTITEPEAGETINAADVHMEAPYYSDPDGDAHLCSDYEIWSISPTQLVWVTSCIGGVEKVHTHLGDGVFTNALAGHSQLDYSTSYFLKVRYRDNSGDAATEWSDYASQSFSTAPAPGGDANRRWSVKQPGYIVETVATGLKLPVNIAFVPNPGTQTNSPLFYVSELYGIIKLVTRDGTLREYANNLLNFNPTGNFPGSGEQGLAGICVATNGDVFATMLYSSDTNSEAAAHYPKVVKLTSSDGGLTASTQTNILLMAGETEGQSHQISAISIGPDGLLYVNNADGFDYTTAQNTNSFRGKVLRMNLDGSPNTGSPFYNASNGTNAADYVYALGFRNPFGGGWRSSDGSYYEVENGPSKDRFAKVVAGRNYLWNNTDASMTNYAIYNWTPPTAPVNVCFVQTNTFGGSAMGMDKYDHAFVTLSGGTWASGPQAGAKSIVEFTLSTNGTYISSDTLVEYVGAGKATIVAIAAGPDGLYFSDFYKDDNSSQPADRGSNILRLRYVGVVDGGSNHTAALKNDGIVYAWGNLLSSSGFTNCLNAQAVGSGLTNIIHLATGNRFTLALKSDKQVYAWGTNGFGQVGNGSSTNLINPTRLTAITNVVYVAAGDWHSVALKSDNRVWSWGRGNTGQLGNGGTTNVLTPAQISGISNVIAVAAGSRHTLAIRTNNLVYAWGDNSSGEIGDGTTTQRNLPVLVSSALTNTVSVAGGNDFSMVLRSDSRVWTWGRGTSGQLGNGATTNCTSPQLQSAISNVVAIAAGGSHALVLKSDGTVWTWGKGTNGQLGNGAKTNNATPVQVVGLSNIVVVAAGEETSYAIHTNGTVYGWGLNANGQLGDGTTTTRSNATAVTGLTLHP